MVSCEGKERTCVLYKGGGHEEVSTEMNGLKFLPWKICFCIRRRSWFFFFFFFS